MFFRKKKMFDDYVDEAYDKHIVLLDVRSSEEFKAGHLKNSKNVPLDKIDTIDIKKDQPLYVYCHSGARSSAAVLQLSKMGYTNITNIGGIYKCKKTLQEG